MQFIRNWPPYGHGSAGPSSNTARVGLRFEADLSNTILTTWRASGGDAATEHALLELWKRRHGCRRAEEYRAPGGVRKAITETAGGFTGICHPGAGAMDIFAVDRLPRIVAEGSGGTRASGRLEGPVPAGSGPEETTLVKRLATWRPAVGYQQEPSNGSGRSRGRTRR
jgi:hypothetical protein